MDGSALALVALGGGLGALGRHAVASAVRRWSAWPGYVAVMIANVCGCVLIALGARHVVDAHATALLVTGFCGSLTTFSAFSLDNALLASERRWRALVFNVGASLVVGIGVTFALYTGWGQ